MNEALILLGIQIALMVVGYLLVVCIGITNKLEALGLSYLFGSGLITLLFLANSYFFNMPLATDNFLFSVAGSIIILGALALYRQKRISLPPIYYYLQRIRKLSCLEQSLIALLLCLFLFTVVENYIWPVTSWDALALYDFRARVIALKSSVDEGVSLGYFFQYPPFTSFLHSFGYIFGVERVKVVYSMMYGSFLLTFFSLLRRNKTMLVSLLGTAFIALDYSIFNHATIAYTNLSYVVFVCLGLIYLLFWIDTASRSDLFIGMILVALSTWVRASDPFWYLSILLLVYGSIKHKKDAWLSLALFVLTLCIYKFWDVYLLRVPGYVTKGVSREGLYLQALFSGQSSIINTIKQMPEILLYFYQNVIKLIQYILPLSLITFYYDIKKNFTFNIYLTILIGLTLGIILSGIIIFSLFYETWNQIGDSLERLSMVLLPLISFQLFSSTVWKKDGKQQTY